MLMKWNKERSESSRSNENSQTVTRKRGRPRKYPVIQSNQEALNKRENLCPTIAVEAKSVLNEQPEKKTTSINNEEPTLLTQNDLQSVIDNNSRVCNDGYIADDTKDNDTLYCSACLIPCKIDLFFSHITKAHTSKSKDQFSTFSIPSLLPKYRLVLPETNGHKKLNFHCDKCNIFHDNKIDYERHVESYHRNVSSSVDKGSPNLYCITCKIHLITKDSIHNHLNCAHYKEKIYKHGPVLPQNSPDVESDVSSRNEPSTSTNSATQLVTKNSQPILFDNPDLFCHICDRKYRDSGAYNVHVLRIHNIRKNTAYQHPIINPDIVPDIDDPNLYCAACEKHFRTPATFRCHLNYKHNINSKLFKKSKVKQISKIKERPQYSRHFRNPTVLPSQHDPTFYCAMCDKRLKSRNSFIAHFKTVHNFHIHNSDQFDSDDPTWRCLLCTAIFPDRDSYKIHAQEIHNFSLATHKTIDDFTCHECKKAYITTNGLNNHLVHVHKLQPKIKTEPETVPKRTKIIMPKQSIMKGSSLRGKKKYECSICEKKFSDAYECGIHKEDDHNIFFIYDDLDYFCNLCEKTLSTKQGYRYHLTSIHLIDNIPEINYDTDEDSTPNLESSQSKGNRKEKLPVMKTEPSDDEWLNNTLRTTYCKLCDISYSSSAHYQLHCFKHHKSN